ncbi:lytic transglycosylase domain-containing protein [Nitrospira defluvii]|nr:lytic transglycosylase domain-containing protein [Nitrospira defluvii]
MFFSPYFIVFILLFFSLDAASMEIYHYTDPSGTIHFTDVPNDPRYRLWNVRPRGQYSFERRKRELFVEDFIDKESREQQVDPALIKAVIRVESDFDSGAVSSAGAQGLMQIMPETAEVLKLKNPFDPEENIRGGTRYLRFLLDRFGQDLTLVLAAYNAGPESVIRYGGIPPYEETTAYIRKVLHFYERYQK